MKKSFLTGAHSEGLCRGRTEALKAAASPSASGQSSALVPLPSTQFQGCRTQGWQELHLAWFILAADRFSPPLTQHLAQQHTQAEHRLYTGGQLVTMFGNLYHWSLGAFIKRENLKGLIFYLHHPASVFTVSIVMPVSIRLKISLATWYFLPKQVFCMLIKLPPHLPFDNKLSSKKAKLCWWGLLCSSQNCSGSFWSPSPFSLAVYKH